MKKTPIFSILIAAVLCAVVVYFTGQIRQYVSDPLTTTLVYEAESQDSIPLDGYLVRQEETFHADSGTISHSQSEGAKVGVGQTLAICYEDASMLETAKQVEAYEDRLEQLEFALNSYLDPDAALRLDSTITESIVQIRQEISGGDYAEGYDRVASLKSSVMKRSYSYTTVEEIEADISEVQKDLAAAKNAISGAREITAPYSGTYSAICDGYETVLTPAFLEGITVEALESITPGADDANVGKLISGDTWYYASVMSEEAADILKDRSTATLRLAKGLNTDLTMSIVEITKSENGKCVIVLKCDKYMAQTTLLRHQAAEIILQKYEGLRVPDTALRVSSEGVSGVYCVAGVTARFKPVDIVWRGNGYALVKPSEGTSGTTVLRIGDEVIATTGEIHDGKVIGLA